MLMMKMMRLFNTDDAFIQPHVLCAALSLFPKQCFGIVGCAGAHRVPVGFPLCEVELSIVVPYRRLSFEAAKKR